MQGITSVRILFRMLSASRARLSSETSSSYEGSAPEPARKAVDALVGAWRTLTTQASRFIHAGGSSLYRLSHRRQRVLQASIPEDGDPDDAAIFQALIEADWAMMEAVVSPLG